MENTTATGSVVDDYSTGASWAACEAHGVLNDPQGNNAPMCREGASPASGVTSEVGLLDEHWTCKLAINHTGGTSIFQPYNPLAILLDVPGTICRNNHCSALLHSLSPGS